MKQKALMLLVTIMLPVIAGCAITVPGVGIIEIGWGFGIAVVLVLALVLGVILFFARRS